MSDSLRVAVAEDYLPLRLCVCELLLAMSATLVEVTNGEQLLVALRGGHFDVVVTDLRMPGTSGLDVLRRLRQTGDRTPFVLMSGAIGSVDHAVAEYDAVVLLEKPFNEDGFRDAVERALAMRPASEVESAERSRSGV
jgi:two-component system, NtrC family, nitrogen regulation response regulator GlnG